VDRARRRDALALVELRRAILAEGQWFLAEPDEAEEGWEAVERQIEGLGQAGPTAWWVARQGSSVVGWLRLDGERLRRLRHVVRLQLMVARPYRQRGVGRALLTAGLAWAEEHPEVAKVSLAVYAHNEAALRLYRAAGFVEEGRRVGEVQLRPGELVDDLLLYRWVSRREASSSAHSASRR
jgi:RimJ/RimL family protein N-acetyltransferase